MDKYQYVVMENMTPVLTVTELRTALAYISERLNLAFADGGTRTGSYWIVKVLVK